MTWGMGGFAALNNMHLDVTLACRDKHEHFLRQLFMQRITETLGHLPEPDLRFLADMQYRARQRQYELDWPDASIYLLRIDDVPVGMAVISEQDEAVHIVDLQVDELHRNKGIGGQLLEHWCVRAIKAGKSAITLSVAKDNPAVRLYLRHGFTVCADTDAHFQMRRPL